jgi:hypothetical protein
LVFGTSGEDRQQGDAEEEEERDEQRLEVHPALWRHGECGDPNARGARAGVRRCKPRPMVPVRGAFERASCCGSQVQNVKTGKLSHEHNLMMQRGPKGETPFASQRPPPPVINLRCYDVLGGAPGISCECECECRPRMHSRQHMRVHTNSPRLRRPGRLSPARVVACSAAARCASPHCAHAGSDHGAH